MNKYFFTVLVGSIVFTLDQITKYWVIKNIVLWLEKIVVIPNFFYLNHIQNSGAAFGFLNNPTSSWQRYFFLIIGLIALICIFYLIYSTPTKNKFTLFCLSLLWGGALGNIIDRILHGYVTDFLSVSIGSYHWPTFNIADSAICIGAICFIAVNFLTLKQK